MPGPWPARGSMMIYGRIARIDSHAVRRRDPQQRVVNGPLEGAAIENHVVVEVQDRLEPRPHKFHKVVPSLAQRVPEQNRALQEID